MVPSTMSARLLSGLFGIVCAGAILAAQPAPTGPRRNTVTAPDFLKTDSPTAGIQEAIDALPESGGVVTLPPGEYLLRRAIRLRSNVTLQGAGAGTILWKKKHAESLLAATVQQGSRSVQVVNANGFSAGDQVAIRDRDAMGWNVVQAIVTAVQGNELTLDHPMPRTCDAAKMGFVIHMFPAITANNASKLVIKDLVVKDEAVRDLTMYGPLNVRSKWGVVLPFPLAAIHLASVSDARIENCVVRGWLSDGISVQGGANDTVIECRIEKCTGKGLHPGGGLHDSLFSHNMSRENADDGLYFCANVQRVTVSENQLIGNKANGVGGLGDWGDTLNTVTKNVISGNGMHGIQMEDGASNAVVGNTISNNSQSAPGQYSGLWLKATSKSTVKDNRCFDDQARKTQQHGIEELADCHENTIADNDCHGNVQADVLLAADQPPVPQPTARQRARAASPATEQPRSATPRASSTVRAAEAAPAVSQQPAVPMKVGPAQIVDSADPTYAGKVRQLRKDDGHEHNFYYYRDPWNADGSRMLGIQSDLQQKDWRVCLHDGNGVFLKELFPIEKYDWRLCWDRNDPDVLYTWKGSDLYRFRVGAGQAELLKSFAPLGLKPNGPSCNQASDRILVVTSDSTFRSYHLPDMSEERTFQIDVPQGCFVGWDKPHYTGYRNYIDTAYSSSDPSRQAIVVYDDTGAVVHKFDSVGGGGHYDYSPDGKLAYFKLPTGGRGRLETPFEIHIVNLDGSGDQVLFTVPRRQAHFSNLHLSWPGKVSDWFVAGFFPMAASAPAENTPRSARVISRAAPPDDRARPVAAPVETSPTAPRSERRPRAAAPSEGPGYEPPLDEILLIRLDGTTKYLARTGTVYSAPAGRGRSGDMFWAQTLPSPSADGKRICFNSNRSGTIDLCLLFLDPAERQ